MKEREGGRGIRAMCFLWTDIQRAIMDTAGKDKEELQKDKCQEMRAM